MASLVLVSRDPLSSNALLVASVFLLIEKNQFSALKVKFFDRFLTLAGVFGVCNVCDVFGVSGVSGARSIIGVRHDVG